MIRRILLCILTTVLLVGCGPLGLFAIEDGLKNFSGATLMSPALPPEAQSIAFSPDGQQLAYATSEGLFVRTVGGQARRLLEPGGAGVSQIVWTADGATLVYAEMEKEPFTRHPDGSMSTTASDSVARLVVTPVAEARPRVLVEHIYSLTLESSTDPRRIAFIGSVGHFSGARDCHLVTLDDGRDERLATDRPVHQFVWSSDGTHLAMASQEGDVYVESVADHRRLVLAADGTYQGAQTLLFWQPDGLALYHGVDRGNQLELRRLGPDLTLAETINIPLTGGAYQQWRPIPGRGALLGLKQESPVGRFVGFASLDIQSRTIRDVSPFGAFAAWAGRTRFLTRVGPTGQVRDYLVEIDGAGHL